VGKIYFNPQTGKFFRATKHKRTPPPGYFYTGLEANFKFSPKLESFFCKRCGYYHFVHTSNEFRAFYPHSESATWRKKLLEYACEVGCAEALKIVRCARLIGGRKQHFDLAFQLWKNGHKRWLSVLHRADAKLRRRFRQLYLAGKLEEAFGCLIAGLMSQKIGSGERDFEKLIMLQTNLAIGWYMPCQEPNSDQAKLAGNHHANANKKCQK